MLRPASALVAYAVLTATLTWPLAVQLHRVVPGDLGDPLLSIWTIWWNATVQPLSAEWWNGPIFFPAPDATTLSDHRLGIGMITTPLIWGGATPLTAYNVAFLVSFVLSAAAAYALCFVMTRHHGAAFVGGLVYGFNPFRAGHLHHLELLASYWLPVALLALHQWLNTRAVRWLVLLAVALTMQGLTSAYYFTFFAVLAGLWMLWYVRSISRKDAATLGVALSVPCVMVAPIAFRYFKAHAAMGLRRTVTDVEHFSADLVGLVTAPDMLWLWNSPPAWNRAEGALYPGVVAVAVVLAGLIAAPRALSPPLPAQMEWMRRVLAAMTIAFAGVTMFVVTGGEFAADVMGVEISVRHGFKPLTMTLLLGSMWLLTSGRMRAAWRSQSALAFYVIATVAMWAFALGPTARLFGERFFYKAPYAWLMLLPGVDTSFRVPARFGMLAALTLSVAVSLALVRLSRTKNARTAGVLIAAVACAVAADSWTRPLQLAVPPRVYRLPDRLPANAAVIELPLGTYEDAAAMYRALTHRRPTVNGLSGYVPPHYEVLYSALSESRVDVLEALAEVAPLVVITHRAQAGELMSSRVRALPSATLLDSDIDRDVVLIPRAPMVPLPGIELTDTVRMQSGHASVSQDTLGLISDRDGTTGWLTPTQQGGEEFVADLGAVQDIDGVVLSLGAFAGGFPRELLVRTSRNGSEWRDAWHGDVSVLAVRAALANQRETPIALPFEARAARYVLVRQVGWSVSPWAVAEFGARGVTRLSRVAR